MRLRAATEDDLAAVRQLLSASNLPLDGVEENLADFIVAAEANDIAGVIGIERYGEAALLRSAAVSPDSREFQGACPDTAVVMKRAFPKRGQV